tara:strand:- start:594 stop:1049 length:456 start_codon:yes stop_codon:yes gene_type:complete
MALVLNTTYNNVFYTNVLAKVRSIITTDRACTVYISPTYRDHGSYSIRLWGLSAETDELFATEWRKLYNTEIAVYSMGDDNDERFYEQLYSDAERLYQLLFNNVNNGAASFPWHDGVVGEITFDDFTGGEEAVDGLHVARFTFSCRLSRVS